MLLGRGLPHGRVQMEQSDAALRGQGRPGRIQQRAGEVASVREGLGSVSDGEADLAQQVAHLLSATSPRHGSRYPRRGSIGPTIRLAARYCAGQPFIRHFNGVFCFIPFQAASLDLVDRAGLYRLTAVVATFNRAAFRRSPMLRASEGPSPENCRMVGHGQIRMRTAHSIDRVGDATLVAHLECDT